MTKKKKRVLWFAQGGGIARCGPFDTQIEAVNAMRLVKREARTRVVGNFLKGLAEVKLVQEPAQRCEFPDDVFVWPEEVEC